jgi:hypothetical protein
MNSRLFALVMLIGSLSSGFAQPEASAAPYRADDVRLGEIVLQAGDPEFDLAGAIAGLFDGMNANTRLVTAQEVMRNAVQMDISVGEKQQVIARLAAACIAMVPPDDGAAMARALVVAGGSEHVATIVATIALAAGTDPAGQAIVNAAVAAGEQLAPGVAAEAARSPDLVVGAALATQVVGAVQSVHAITVKPPAEPVLPAQTPILAPPAPPRAHPYEGQ